MKKKITYWSKFAEVLAYQGHSTGLWRVVVSYDLMSIRIKEYEDVNDVDLRKVIIEAELIAKRFLEKNEEKEDQSSKQFLLERGYDEPK